MGHHEAKTYNLLGLLVLILWIFALVNCAWTFDGSGKATDNSDDGGLLWTGGVGFNY